MPKVPVYYIEGKALPLSGGNKSMKAKTGKRTTDKMRGSGPNVFAEPKKKRPPRKGPKV